MYFDIILYLMLCQTSDWKSYYLPRWDEISSIRDEARYHLIMTCERPILRRMASRRYGHRFITNILTLMDQRRFLSLTAVSDAAFGTKRPVNSPVFAYRWHCGSFTATYFTAAPVGHPQIRLCDIRCRASPSLSKTSRKRYVSVHYYAEKWSRWRRKKKSVEKQQREHGGCADRGAAISECDELMFDDLTDLCRIKLCSLTRDSLLSRG